MNQTLLGIALVVAILVVSAVFTQLLARRMYNQCAKCGTLNAKRRSRCRSCGEGL